MTHREAIQQMVDETERLYDIVGGMRDAATLDEKKHWNSLRRQYRDASSILRSLDDSLSDGRASEPGYKLPPHE
jgi:hypothetical protein